MLQSRLTFDLLFHRGISPKRGKNLNYFSEVENLKPTEEGFISIDKDEFSFLVGSGQVFNIGVNSFLFSGGYIYKINSDNSLTLKLSNVPILGRWTCADFKTYALFSNGRCIVVMNDTGVFQLSTSIPNCKSLYNFNGQLIMGGLDLSVNSYIPNCVPSLEEAKSFILYSGIGNVNIVPSETNVEAGFRDVNEIGEIVGLGGWEDMVVVLGKGGLVVLKPVDYYFGLVKGSSFGPRDEWSWSFTDDGVFFIDKNGSLWVMERNEKVTLLGFSYLFKGVSVKMFTVRGEVFVNDGNKTYVVSKEGVYSLSGRFNGIIGNAGGDRYLVEVTPSLADCKFVTSVLDFKDPGLKLLEEISLGVAAGEVDSNLSFRVWTRGDLRGSWYASPWYRLNKENVCRPHVAGSEFKIEFKNTNFSFVCPSWMDVSYSKIDKRYNRGHSFVDINKEG